MRTSANDPSRRTRGWLGMLLGAVAAVSLVMIALGDAMPLAASGSPAEQAAKDKHYKGTRAYVVDKQTGQLRLPTQQEADEVVANLSSLGQRAPETLQQSSQPGGGVIVNLDGGFGGIVLARPNGDGTWETKCVFTLEEGAEFLGIVVDDAAQ